MAALIHQANVRRDAVIGFIDSLRARGHRYYTHRSMSAIHGEAKGLPIHGVPPRNLFDSSRKVTCLINVNTKRVRHLYQYQEQWMMRLSNEQYQC